MAAQLQAAEALAAAAEAVKENVKAVTQALNEDHTRSGCNRDECWMMDSIELLARGYSSLHRALAAWQQAQGQEG
jgi:hypothetical protein